MKIGFGKVDVTPRVGVELCGFGAFITRHSTRIRDRLYARAMAASDGTNTVVLVSADLVGVSEAARDEVRQRVCDATGVPPDNVMVHCTHTHSGPCTMDLIGWGQPDAPYLELLPVRLAEACTQALRNMVDAQLSHAEVPAQGIGYNRELDKRPELSEALSEDYRPATPELTDTTAHVVRVDADGRLLGFVSYFSCHPVVCCASTHAIHGDYCGVATNLIEREHPGAVGLFLQGAHGNINTCVVHVDEQGSMLALDVIASRYARAVRSGLETARPLNGSLVAAVRQEQELARADLTPTQLTQMLAEKDAVLKAPGASDADREFRMATVYAVAFRRLLEQMSLGKRLAPPVELQALRIGDLTIVGAPFELFHRIKRRVQGTFESEIVLVLSVTNGALGYAPEKEAFESEGGYAAHVVPFMIGILPFTPQIEDELVRAMTALVEELPRPENSE